VTGGRNVKGGIAMLAFGLAGGLAMSLYAFQPMVPVPASLAHYDDLPRRLFRLGHIAAIMLPLINVVLGGWLDRLNLSRRWREAASWLLLVGGVSLPATLTFEALVPTVIGVHLSAAPAVAFTLGVFICAVGALRTTFSGEVAHAVRDQRGATGLRDREKALPEGVRR
jgi:hypothetical protein